MFNGARLHSKQTVKLCSTFHLILVQESQVQWLWNLLSWLKRAIEARQCMTGQLLNEGPEKQLCKVKSGCVGNPKTLNMLEIGDICQGELCISSWIILRARFILRAAKFEGQSHMTLQQRMWSDGILGFYLLGFGSIFPPYAQFVPFIIYILWHCMLEIYIF